MRQFVLICINQLQVKMLNIQNIKLPKSSDQRDELLVQAEQSYKKIVKYFYHTLPNNFNLTNNVIYGECKMQYISYDKENPVEEDYAVKLEQNNRKNCRYIANNEQILMLQISNNIHEKSLRNKYNSSYHCISYEDIIQIKVSMYYADIMLIFNAYGQSTNVKCVIIEPIEIGLEKAQQFRSYILRYYTNSTKNPKVTNSQCTLLNYSHLATSSIRDQEEDDNEEQLNREKVKIVTNKEIKSTRIVNVRKLKQKIIDEVIKKDQILYVRQNVDSNTSSSIDINKVYNFHSENISKTNQVSCYIVNKYISKNVANSRKLYTIKTITQQKIKYNTELLSCIHTECQVYKHQEVITPYIPILNRASFMGELFVMEYQHFQGLTLRELIIREKINIQKKYFRQLIGQIVMAVGHIHECGFMYSVDIDNVLVNFDGHVYLTDLGSIIKVNSHKYDNEAIQKYDIRQTPRKKKVFQASTMKTKVKQCKKKCPEEFLNPKQNKFSWDWWALGLLLYQIVANNHYFENETSIEIYRALTDGEKDLNLDRVQKKLQKQPELLDLMRKILKKNEKQRIGSKNDYHNILNEQYFKEIDKKKLTKREGQAIMKIKHTKMNDKGKVIENKNEKVKKNKDTRMETEMKPLEEVYKNWEQVLNECIFNFDLDYSE